VKVSWTKVEEVVNHMHMRERRMLCITVVAVTAFIQVLMLWDPIYKSGLKAYQENIGISQQIKEAKDTIKRLKERAAVDVNAHQKNQIKKFKERLTIQQHQIESLTSALISPKNMGKVFTGLLQENTLSLEKISNLDAKPVNIEGQVEETNLLYEHGLSLELKGQYMNALKYLQSLESQDWQLYWDELKFSSNTYPNGTLTIEVHTLSTSDSLLDL
jgi:MSHA biogenesis protein MshJ